MALFKKYWGFLILAVFFAVLSWMTVLEPVVHDCWGPFIDGTVFHDSLLKLVKAYAPAQSNPRIGELFLRISYWKTPLHQIVAPSLIVFLFIQFFMLSTQRWPRFNSVKDMFGICATSALTWLTIPLVGGTFFYRPVLTNYVFGLVFTLLPFCLWLQPSWRKNNLSMGQAMSAVFLGALAGMSNEHTGLPALLVLTCLIAYTVRFEHVWPIPVCVLYVFFVLGYVFLMTAKGQSVRYEGLATQESIAARILERGFIGNLTLLKECFAPMQPLLLLTLLVSGWTYRTQRSWKALSVPALFVAASVLIAMAILGSPLVADRLYFASRMMLIGASVWALYSVCLNHTWCFLGLTTALAYHVCFFHEAIPLYKNYHTDSYKRIAAIQQNPENTMTTPLMRNSERSRLFFGDDFKYPNARLRTQKLWIAGKERHKQ